MPMDITKLIEQLTLEEKASLCSGKDFWHLKGIEHLNIPSIMVTDGPHGLRKQPKESDHLGLNDSIPATCFPAACTTSCSFDPDLLREMGTALAEECLQEEVAVLLGPGANIKRSPLCGRNFEYISEDPFVTGELSAALIEGIQNKGIGASLKHFAANNQETRRMSTDSVVDERALREIYLTGFEMAVKKAKPQTVMCSYNRMDGVYLSNHKRMLTEILHDEWGFSGLVVTDWGAMDDRVEGIRAGLDLQMPGPSPFSDLAIVKAVQNGEITEEELNISIKRILELVLRHKSLENKGQKYDKEAHHKLAQKVAAQSTVLLKNENSLLPLQPQKSVAVIGAFAKNPRYQGSGSSKIAPTQLDNAVEALKEAGFLFDYSDGYSLKNKGNGSSQQLISEACALAESKDIVLLFAGLPDSMESEGIDRSTMDMPKAQIDLIDAVSEVNKNIVVILQCGAPILMPWADKVQSIVLSYLGGQAGGKGTVDVLLGNVNPSGKLAESFPLQLKDNPSYNYFPGYEKSVEYRESIFVGYRYYDKAEKDVLFPFGHGLSYTEFSYSNITLSQDSLHMPKSENGDCLTVSFDLKNIGSIAGAEVAQVYVGLSTSKIMRPLRELKGFQKVFLEPNAEKRITISLQSRSFSYYNIAIKDWAVESGVYEISVGSSSRDLRLNTTIEVVGDDKEELLSWQKEKLSTYFNFPKTEMEVSEDKFSILYGKPLPDRTHIKGMPFTKNNTIGDVKDTLAGKITIKASKAIAGKMAGDDEEAKAIIDSAVLDAPLRAMLTTGDPRLTIGRLDGLVDMYNGKYLRGFWRLIKG